MNKKLFLTTMLIIFLSINVTAQSLTGDPWIFQAYKELYARSPNAFELNINNYNLGSWNSYPELKNISRNSRAMDILLKQPPLPLTGRRLYFMKVTLLWLLL